MFGLKGTTIGNEGTDIFCYTEFMKFLGWTSVLKSAIIRFIAIFLDSSRQEWRSSLKTDMSDSPHVTQNLSFAINKLYDLPDFSI
jgi:hypothetical protein